MENGKARAIFGVGNKADLYREEDLVQMDLVANDLNKIIKQRKAENDLRESREEYRSLFANMLDGFVHCKMIFDEEGKPVDLVYLEVNEAFERLTGLKKETVIGKTATEAIPGIKEANPELFDIYGRVAITGKEERFEFFFEPMSMWFSISVYSSKRGYFAAVFENITERKKAEEISFEHSSIVSSASDAIFSTDNSLVFKSWNKSAERIFGWKAEEVVGKTSTSIFNVDYPTLNGKTRKEALEQLRRNGFWKGEVVYHKKDGSPIPVSVSSNVVKDTTGSVAGFVAIVHDVSARKRREAVLRESQHDLNRAQSVAKTGSWRLDTQRNVLLWSRENHRIFGVPKGTPMTYETFLEMVHPDDRAYVDRKWKAGLEGEPYDIEHRIIVDGKVKWVRERAELEFAKDRTLLGGFGTTQDITDFVEMREKLRFYTKHLEELVEEKTKLLKDAERLAAIGQTAGMVGHDIRNPLQAITNYIYLAKEDLASLPEGEEKASLEETLTEIEKSVNYINKIVADLQDFAKPLHPCGEETDLTAVINDLLIKSRLPDNVLSQVRISNSAAVVMADAAFVNRIIGNLVSNAVQAMPNGGCLSIEAFKDSRDTVITVADTGVGIPEAVKGKLFQPLFTTKSKGQGFGLAVVKRMTDALGGTITFESQVGKGTKFTLRLPPPKTGN
jgi:PAS domain S-box-containing protein